MNNWYVYIARCNDDTLYTGVTTDVERRILKHNSGKGAKYTRARIPISLEWSEAAINESAAKMREAEIKKWSRDQKLKFITDGGRA